jgi:hypothetical protein
MLHSVIAGNEDQLFNENIDLIWLVLTDSSITETLKYQL